MENTDHGPAELRDDDDAQIAWIEVPGCCFVGGLSRVDAEALQEWFPLFSGVHADDLVPSDRESAPDQREDDSNGDDPDDDEDADRAPVIELLMPVEYDPRKQPPYLPRPLLTLPIDLAHAYAGKILTSQDLAKLDYVTAETGDARTQSTRRGMKRRVR